MQFNFFTWIREGVRQAVLLGVSDAIEHIGAPPEGGNLSEHLLAGLRPDGAASLPQQMSGDAKRKRLGRSLKDIEGEKK
jgi:hypothetical protein